MAPDQTVLFVVIAAMCIAATEGHQCYMCVATSTGHEGHSPEEHAKHEKCLDPANLGPGDTDLIQECKGTFLGNGCTKTKTTIGDTVTIARACGIAKDECNEESTGNAKVAACFCKGNLCNGAPSVKSTLAILAIIFSLMAYYM